MKIKHISITLQTFIIQLFMKSVIEVYKKSINSRLAEKKLNIKSTPNIYAEKF